VKAVFAVITPAAIQVAPLCRKKLTMSQLSVMNKAYGSHGITFKLISTDFTTNNAWATGNSDDQMKPGTLRRYGFLQ